VLALPVQACHRRGGGRVTDCPHPPQRLFTWFALDLAGKRTILCVGCCACGAVLRGAEGV